MERRAPLAPVDSSVRNLLQITVGRRALLGGSWRPRTRGAAPPEVGHATSCPSRRNCGWTIPRVACWPRGSSPWYHPHTTVRSPAPGRTWGFDSKGQQLARKMGKLEAIAEQLQKIAELREIAKKNVDLNAPPVSIHTRTHPQYWNNKYHWVQKTPRSGETKGRHSRTRGYKMLMSPIHPCSKSGAAVASNSVCQ